jgi:hypothetical protein
VKAPTSSQLKKIVLIALFGSLAWSVSAQGPGQKSEFWSHVRYGGGIGLGFSNSSFTIALAPSAIYQVSPQFAAGVGLSFNYSKFEPTSFDRSEFTAFGGSLVSFFNPIPQMQLSAEFEQIRVNRKDVVVGETFEDSFWSPALYFGLGVGNRNVMAGMRYNVLFNDEKSIYASAWAPFVRVYF